MPILPDFRAIAAATVLVCGLFPCASQAAVVLTVSDRAGGGVDIVATGSIDVSGFTHVFDAPNQFINTYSFANTNLTANGANGGLELWSSAGATYTRPTTSAINISFSSYGSFGHGLVVDSLGRLGVYAAAGFADDNLAPAGASVFHFDFEGFSAVYGTDRFIDGTVIWDSNGAAAGGETVTLRVIPEPSSALLLATSVLGLVARRRRAR
jgi:hypothetical protein